MYEIFSDDVLLYAPYLKAEDKKILNPKWVMELGKAGELTFIAPPESPLYLGQNTNDDETRYRKLTSTIWLKKNATPIWSGRVLHDDKDFYGNKEVYCEGRLAYLNDGIMFPYSFGYSSKKPSFIGSNDRYSASPLSLAGGGSSSSGNLNILYVYTREYNKYQQNNKKIQPGNLDAESFGLEQNKRTLKAKSNEHNSIMTELTEKLITEGELDGYLSIRYVVNNDQSITSFLDFLKFETGHETGQVIRFGENLLDLTEYVSTENVFTVITPLGKSTTNYIYKGNGNVCNIAPQNEENKRTILWNWLVSNGIKSGPIPDNDEFISTEFPETETGPRITVDSVNNGYSYIPRPDQWNNSADFNITTYGTIERTVVFDDVDKPQDLYDLGIKQLSLMGLIDTITINAADLSIINVVPDDINLGDMVTIESVPHGISAKLQCRKIEIDFENPMNTVFTFGNTTTGLTDKQLDSSKKTLRNTEKIDENTTAVNSITAVDSEGLSMYLKRYELQNAVNAIRQLPSVTTSDNGKILQVVDGNWRVVDMPSDNPIT